MVRVYGRESCVQCEYTTKKLQEAGVPYTYLDIAKDEEARKCVEQSGRFQLPMVVVQAGEQFHQWWGFSPDRIKALSELQIG